MHRRDISKALLATAAGSGVLAERAHAQTLNAPSFARTAAEIAAGVTPTDLRYSPTGPCDIRRYGAQQSNTDSQNLAALNQAILVAQSSAGAVVIMVPADCHYGYHYTTQSTFPQLRGTVPIVVVDYSQGSSFSGYPTIYDGTQIRYFYFTPDTTAQVTFTGPLPAGAMSAKLAVPWTLSTGPWQTVFSNGNLRYVTFTEGTRSASWTSALSSATTATATYSNTAQHNGNTEYLRGTWNPGIMISNDSFLPAPGSATRTALDNRRCQISYGNDGIEWWKLGQGTLIGATLTDEELSNFALVQVPVAGDTITNSFVPFLVQRKTGNMSFGSGSNVPAASYEFYSVSAGCDQAIFWNNFDESSRILLRPQTGSIDDAHVGMNCATGTLSLGFRATGEALLIDKASRIVTTARAFRRPVVSVSYGSSITFNADDGYIFTITATNGHNFTINAPKNAGTGMTIALEIKNSSGGTLGAITWNSIFKMAAWTPPANGFTRAITFYFNDCNWRELSRSADVPN
ncbi:MAG: hypothetical protein ACJ8R9_08675 [Steroidobacteraceae bacterium]